MKKLSEALRYLKEQMGEVGFVAFLIGVMFVIGFVSYLLK